MPTLTPTPTIQIPVAPVRVIAQTPRSGRTGGAIEQESTSFLSALQSAKRPSSRPIEDAPARSDAGDAAAKADTETPGAASAQTESTSERTDPSKPTDQSVESGIDDAAAEIDQEPEPEIEAGISVIDPSQVITAPASPTQAPTIADGSKGSDPDQADPEAARAQVSQQAGLTKTAEPNEAPSGQEAAEAKPSTKPAAPTDARSAIAPAPQPQPNTASPTENAEASVEAQAALPQSRGDAQTASGEGEGTDQQKHAAPAGAESGDPAQTSAPTDTAAAQALRHAGAESAPVQVDPSSIEAPTPGNITGKPSVQPQASSAPSLGSVEPDQAFTTAVNRGLAAAVRQQGGTLTIKLDPPTLGKLTIRMTIDQGRVEATFDVQTAQARDLLMEHSSTLRAQLRERGLTVERFEVIGATGASKPGHSASNPGHQPGSDGEQGDPRHDAAGGQSRGRSETGEEQPSTGDGATGETAGIAGEPLTSPFETQLRYSVNAVG